jgi:hypothetical protein
MIVLCMVGHTYIHKIHNNNNNNNNNNNKYIKINT